MKFLKKETTSWLLSSSLIKNIIRLQYNFSVFFMENGTYQIAVKVIGNICEIWSKNRGSLEIHSTLEIACIKRLPQGRSQIYETGRTNLSLHRVLFFSFK